MTAKIIATTQKETFSGIKYGFVLDSKNEADENDIYFPFFQYLVNKDAVGKSLSVETSNGNKTEALINH